MKPEPPVTRIVLQGRMEILIEGIVPGAEFGEVVALQGGVGGALCGSAKVVGGDGFDSAGLLAELLNSAGKLVATGGAAIGDMEGAGAGEQFDEDFAEV